MTDEEKAKIPEETLKKLEEAEQQIAAQKQEAEDAKAVEDASTAINNSIPDELTLDDEDKIKEARDAYDSLTPEQQAKVDPSVVEKLEAAEQEIAKQKQEKEDTDEANRVKELIDALSDPETVKTLDKDQIEEARTAYDALTEEQKAKIDDETLKHLTDDEGTLQTITVQEEINTIDPAKAADDREAVEKAREEYDALTEEQKKTVDTTKLVAAEIEIKDTDAANSVSTLINALASPDAVVTKDKDQIQAAKKAFDALTPAQKEKLPKDVVEKLKADITAQEDSEAADTVTEQIISSVALNTKDAVYAARAAYNALTPAQKKRVKPEILEQLEKAETALAEDGAKEPELPSPAEVEASILNMTTDDDIAGSTFWKLKARQKSVGKRSITISWDKVPAEYYVIYGNQCGQRSKKIATVNGSKNTFTQKKLKSGRYYKYIVVAVNNRKTVAIA